MANGFLTKTYSAVSILVSLFIILGILYPLFFLGIGKLCFPYQTNGSLISRKGAIIGSELIQQEFTGSKLFHGRPSIVVASNTPTSKLMLDRIEKRIAIDQKLNAEEGKPVPIDLITDSGSGVDPDISPRAAYYQAVRVSRANHIPLDSVKKLIAKNTKGRDLGFLGPPTVNVLNLNLALIDSLSETRGKRSH